MTKLKAIKELYRCDHEFLGPKGANKLAKPFGFTPTLRTQTDTRSQHKGLTLYGINPATKKKYKEGDTAEGLDAHQLAMQICRHLEIDFDRYFGIGSQLRECCSKIEKHLTN